jgi:SMC interacting uncharacterized protein involved in chromosome segregation
MDNPLLIILGVIQAIFIVAIPAYMKYITAKIEREKATDIAKIENADDLTAVQIQVQREHSDSYRLLVEDTKNSIIEAKKTKEEMQQLREYVNRLELRIVELEKDGKRKDVLIAELQASEKKKDSEIRSLRQRIARIKGELDTGPLDSK